VEGYCYEAGAAAPTPRPVTAAMDDEQAPRESVVRFRFRVNRAVSLERPFGSSPSSISALRSTGLATPALPPYDSAAAGGPFVPRAVAIRPER
jgi:hypothetical protein